MGEIKEIAHLSRKKRELLLRRLIDGSKSELPIPSQPRDSKGFPLSFSQQRLWFLDRLIPGNPFYSLPAAIRLRLPLSIPVLKRSVNEIVRRHEALRTTLTSVNGQPVQVIAPKLVVDLPVHDLRHLPEAEREAEALRLATVEAQRSFDLAQGPLVRTSLLQLAQDDYVFLLTMHHIVTDGWSMDIFSRELSALYTAFAESQPPKLPDLPIQYADFAVWQRQWLQGEVLKNQLSYWSKQLERLSPLQLSTDHPRPAVQRFRGALRRLGIDANLAAALRKLSQQEGATLFMTLLAAFKTLLHRYTGQDDIVVGSPIANRERPEIQNLIGFFVNTLVFRSDLSADPTFRELLGRVRRVALDAYSHQDLPFEKLVEELHPERDLSRNPLFQVVFQLLQAPTVAQQTSDPRHSLLEVKRGTASFDLACHLQETPEGISGVIEYSTDLFEADSIDRMVGHFQKLLEGIAANPDCPVSQLSMLNEVERQLLLVEWNQTESEYPRTSSIARIFEEQVERRGEAVAVVCGEQELSYRELNRRANQLGHYLRRQGVRRGVLVGVYLERSAEMVVGLLGILKAGGAYVPLDPSYPPGRLEFMRAETGMPVLLTQEQLAKEWATEGVRVVVVDQESEEIGKEVESNPDTGVGGGDLAYVIYTSGSTGQPKGVSVPQQGVVRLVRGTDYAQLDAEQVFLQFAPISFDAATFEIWGALLNGGRLVLYPPGRASLEELGEVLERHRVTTLWLTAGLFHQMVDDHLEGLGRVRQLLAGGDVLSVVQVRKFLEAHKECRLINGYGPTESTTFTCCYGIKSSEEELGATVPIGRPIANTEVYVLDRHRQPVPIGVPGELHIGGDGLALGYWRQPELTAEKFVGHPFRAGARLYKTGDLVRYRFDGELEFLGRMDQQVKIRGYRVEPGEVEAVLRLHPEVRDTTVLARQDASGDKRLIAYFVCEPDHEPLASELRGFLRDNLPDFMIPSAFVRLDEMPLSPNGKPNREALAGLQGIQAEVETSYAAPQTELEHGLMEIWKSVLQLENVGVNDNFFDLGGHSLLMVRLHSRLREVLTTPLPIIDLFRYPTVRSLAQKLRQSEESSRSLEDVEERAQKRKQVRALRRRTHRSP